MIPALFLALSLQAGPELRVIESLTDGVHRPYLWAPLEIEVFSESTFEGDVVAWSSFGFAVRKKIRLEAGARSRFLLPAIDPEKIQVGKSEKAVPRTSRRATWLVGVDARLDYADDLTAGADVALRKLRPESLDALVTGSLGEAFDLILLSAGDEGVRGTRAATREEAERAIAALTPRERIPVVDRGVWRLEPQADWVQDKRTFAVLFTTVYVFAGFVALVGVMRRHPGRAPWAVGGVALLGVVVFAFLPHGALWVTGSTCEVAWEGRDSEEWRVWFVGTETELTTEVEFPLHLVKPVLHDPFAEPFVIRVLDRGSRVEGLHLKPGRSACFTGMTARPPSLAIVPELSATLADAGVRHEEGVRRLGDLEKGAKIDFAGKAGDPIPPDPEFRAFERFLTGTCVYGWLSRSDRRDDGVTSPELDVPRLRPGFFISRKP